VLLCALLDLANFHLINTALGLFMISSLLLLTIELPTRQMYGYFISIVALTSIFEASLGVVQLMASNFGRLDFSSMGAGDAVVGTLLTNSHLYAAKMLTQALILATARAYGNKGVAVNAGLVFALLGAVLASALFLTALFSLGIVLATVILLRRKNVDRNVAVYLRKLGRNVLLALIAIGSIMFVTQVENVNYVIATISSSTSQSDNYGKVVSTRKSLELVLSDLKIFTMGTGIGNYSSRAAFVLSGEYLKSQSEIIPVSISSYTNEVILPMWNRAIWGIQYSDGVLNQPFYTLQTFVVEGGIIGVLFIIVIYIRTMHLVSKSKAVTNESSMLNVLVLYLLVVLPFVFLSDNWHEYPSFMIPVLLPIAWVLNASRLR
jgi:hypothetical protein